MSEKAPAFVVVDRRKFTSEGEIREGYTPPPVEVATPPEAVVSTPLTSSLPAASAAGVVMMPSRSTVEADDFGSAADRREEELSAAGLDVDGDGLSSDEEAAELGQYAGDQYSGGQYDGDEYAEQDMTPGPPPTAAETATQQREYQRLGRQMDALLQQANPGLKPTAAVGFEHIVQSFYLSAIMAMGAGAEPGQKPRIDILGARQSIDMLNVLGEKTRGNLDDKEQRLLDGVAFELRMMFLELTNAIAAQAQQAPPPGRK